ncbi:MAG: RimK family alpha-L-glutamate ligase [Candidatus Nomurabacteria bacterium]|jgi:RimK family alpha-L-glutamate ligase|nr:RimK family alpha-L-glutamate ligase [Candidatus Nomurabacteria bacterium]
MQNNLWLIFESNTSQMEPLVQSANKLNVSHDVKYIEKFSVKDSELFYNNELVAELPKLVLMRAYVDGQEAVHKYFEEHGVQVIDNWATVDLINDKLKTHQLLEKHGVKQPKFLAPILNDTPSFESVTEKLGLPFVIKDTHGQCGSSVFLIYNANDYEKAMKKLTGAEIILQEYIEESSGKDLRTYVIGDYVVPIGMIRNNGDSFISNVAAGGKMTRIDLTPEQKSESLQIAKILGGEIISVDYLIKNDELYFCEANTNASAIEFYDLVADPTMLYIKEILE